MRHYFLIILSVTSLIGCASTKKTIMPNGLVGYSIDCSGTAVSMNTCYEKAGELCPNGYDVHTKDQSGGWIATSSFAGATSMKGMLVSCKESRNFASEN